MTDPRAGRRAAYEVELRRLFDQEATKRLDRMTEVLLALERDPGGAGADDAVAELFRDAHTIKGSAGMLRLAPVTEAGHALEELLDRVREGALPVTPPLVDALLAGVDGVRALVAATLAGEAADPAAVVATLTAAAGAGVAGVAGSASGAAEPTAPVPAPVPTPLPAPTAAPTPVPAPAPAPAARVPQAPDPGTSLSIPADRLDEVVRLVGEAAAAQLRLGGILTDAGVDPADDADYRALIRTLADLQDRVMRLRMVPVATVTAALERAVRDLARRLGKQVRWEVRGADTELDRGVLTTLTDALLHLVRNAVDHGIEPPAERLAAGKPADGVVRLHAMQLGPEVVLAVSDDGRGVDLPAVRRAAGELDGDLELVFRSGVSTAVTVTEISGRGVGLDAVRSGLDAVRGRVDLRSEPGRGSEFRVAVPVRLALLSCLVVEAAGHRYAVPLHAVVTTLPATTERVRSEGLTAVLVDGAPVPVTPLAEVLSRGGVATTGPVAVVAGRGRRWALEVDRLLGQREVVARGLPSVLPRLEAVAGASVEPDGGVLLVLDPAGLADLAARDAVPTSEGPARAPAPAARVLVVDDALTVRELQRAILERAGYTVRTAADGHEALTLLGEEPAELVLTDVQMPGLDGIALTRALRAHPRLSSMAVLVLTSLGGADDRERALEAGADGYLVKSAFDETALLDAVRRLLGAA